MVRKEGAVPKVVVEMASVALVADPQAMVGWTDSEETTCHCLKGNGEHLHFNAAPQGRGRADLAPVCHTVGRPPTSHQRGNI